MLLLILVSVVIIFFVVDGLKNEIGMKDVKAGEMHGDMDEPPNRNNVVIEWEKTFGGQYHDYGADIQRTMDGGYIIVGGSRWGTGIAGLKLWLIKTDSDGNIEWEIKEGDCYSMAGNSVQQTSDGGYIVTGGWCYSISSNYRLLLMKFDSNGNEIWRKIYGDGSGRSVQQTSDGGYIIVGKISTTVGNYGDTNIWLIKTDSDGNRMGQKIWRIFFM